jgi:ABC-type multidrug transport system permease subunit
MVSISAAVTVIFYLIIAGVIFGLLYWTIGAVGTPEPFNRVARVMLILLAVFVAIGLLLSLVGGQQVFRP